MTESGEIVLEVSRELVENCNGFSMDFGGSVLKLVYRNKEDWDELQSNDSNVTTAKLRLRSYSRPDFKGALELLKERCYINTREQSPTIFTTGISCFEYADTIKNTLKVKTKNVNEADCFIKAFHYLTDKLSRKRLVYESSARSKLKVRAMEEDIVKLMSAWKTGFDDTRTQMKIVKVQLADHEKESTDSSGVNDQPLTTGFPDMYPCIVAMLGSVFSFTQVNADGSFEIVDITIRGGRMFLGLGSLLAGHTASYDELLELAINGNNRNIDDFLSDFKQDEKQGSSCNEDDESENIYRSLCTPGTTADIIFSFGKAASANENEFKTEDVIRTHLNTMVMDLVQDLQHIMIRRNIKHCFLAGSFLNHELVRDLIAMEFVRKKIQAAAFGEGKVLDTEVYFLKIGAYFGALGALINHTVDFI